MAKLWPDERINKAIETQDTIDVLEDMRDEYEAVIAKLVAYAISLEGQIEVLKRKTPHVIEFNPDTPNKTFEEAAAAIRAEFGTHYNSYT